jgi:hypothetical protein
MSAVTCLVRRAGVLNASALRSRRVTVDTIRNRFQQLRHELTHMWHVFCWAEPTCTQLTVISLCCRDLVILWITYCFMSLLHRYYFSYHHHYSSNLEKIASFLLRIFIYFPPFFRIAFPYLACPIVTPIPLLTSLSFKFSFLAPVLPVLSLSYLYLLPFFPSYWPSVPFVCSNIVYMVWININIILI